MKKFAWAAAIAAGIIAAAYFAWQSGSQHHTNGLQTVHIAAPPQSDDVAAGNSSPASHALASSAKKAEVSSPRQLFERSRDLFALTQELQAAADAGDVEAQTVIADAYFECAMAVKVPVARNVGALAAEKKNPQLKPYIDNLIETDRARCSRFTKQDFAAVKMASDVYAYAAKNGSAKALAMHFVYSDTSTVPDAELAAKMQQIMASRDPNAIGALSDLMGLRAENREAAFGSPSGTAIQQYAWLLAACRMGMDCGADSYIVRSYCLNAGVCGVGSVDQMVESSFLSPADYRTAVAQSREIVKKLVHSP